MTICIPYLVAARNETIGFLDYSFKILLGVDMVDGEVVGTPLPDGTSSFVHPFRFPMDECTGDQYLDVVQQVMQILANAI